MSNLDPRGTKDYWNKRVKESGNNDQELVFKDKRFFEHQDITVNFLKLILKPGMLVIDVGCGPGRFYKYVTEMGCDYIGYDFSEEMISLARERNPKGTFRTMDVRDIKSIEKADLAMSIICMSSIEPDFHRMTQLLKKFGKSILIHEAEFLFYQCD